MIASRNRRRAAALALSVCAVLLPASASATTSDATGDPAPPAEPAGTVQPAGTAEAPRAADLCPPVTDPLFAAADRSVEADRISPAPTWRTNCKQLYRAESRAPEIVFEQGFLPKAPVNGQYDVEKHVLAGQDSPYVSATHDHDLYKQESVSGFNYYIDAPGGIDVNRTIGATHKAAHREEVAFPGGVSRELIVGVCPVDRAKKTEIMAECQDNPHYKPWRG
ncbi:MULTISPECIES: ADP-ribosyltransferase [unclassified Streptomyces]|uniref:ADP-ribosyltransferase n=1 Tax=unclassified Streptomyces TaxID=2593676 RepID=UPI002E2D0FE4|nr:ADP-ribosyltransferase [Streptomyces sp. NBC_01429]